MIDAALRHLRGARAALASGDYEQAAHLVGFAPECARKAAIAEPDLWKKLGHDFSAHPFLNALSALRPEGLRLRVDRLDSEFPVLRAWDPQIRYLKDGQISKYEAEDLERAAAEATARLVFAMTLEGRRDVLERLEREEQ